MRIEQGFQQTPYGSLNPYSSDPVLPGLVRRLIPPSIHREIEQDLVRLGDELVDEIRPLSPLVHQATLTQYDHWGRRIDDLHTSEGWRKLEAFAIKEGYVANAYVRKYGELSRLYSFFKVMVMTGDCNVIMCPMGMTDGGARTIELFGTDKMKRELFPRLISTDPRTSYLSGQWMTERPGGSDLSQTETTAVATTPESDDLGAPYLLNGMKWFSSAAEGNLSVALARTSNVSHSSRGLSLFVVPLRHGRYPSPLSNGVHMHRLKNKFGTHGVPTAELSLEQTRGWLIGELDQGVKTVATVLNITRIHSAVHLAGSLQRCLAIARSYAEVRMIDGGRKSLKDAPLHMATLADATMLYRAITHVTFGMVVLLGKSECGVASEDEELRLRLLTPAVKGYASVKCPTAMEEMMGSLGGLGYMEEVGIGRLIRDSLVERIWEGTVNILALDLGRAAKNPKTLESYMTWSRSLISSTLNEPCVAGIRPTAVALSELLEKLPGFFSQSAVNPLLPRAVLNFFTSISCALYLLEHALWSVKSGEASSTIDVEAFRRWVEEGDMQGYLRDITALEREQEGRAASDLRMVYGAQATSISAARL